MTERERKKLLFGPYQTPRLKYGDRAFCLLRDQAVKVIGLSDAPIIWPRCRGLEQRGGHGVLVDEELARAVRNESATAISHWWGVSMGAVENWRKALGAATRTKNPGTHRLVLGAVTATLEARRRKGRTARARSRPATVWSAKELALLGAAPDPEVAKRTGRSLDAVNKRRNSLGRAALTEGPRGARTLFWNATDKALIGVLPDPEVAKRTGRSLMAVREGRRKLGRKAVAKGPRGERDYFWGAEEDATLRAMPAKDAAKQLNRSIESIYRRRRVLGIAADWRWTAEEDAIIRTTSVEEALRTLNRTIEAVRSRRKTLGVAKPKNSRPARSPEQVKGQ